MGLALACAPQTRHAVLDFVFDGVPPYRAPGEEGPLPAVGAGAADPDEAWRLEYARRLQLLSRTEPEAARRFAHQPFAENQCGECHTSQRFSELSDSGWSTVEGGGFAAEDLAEGGRLLQPVDQLCLRCHEGYRPGHPENAGLRMHGPVVSGWCVTCHQPHSSPYAHLLHTEPAASLCLRCHQSADLLAFTAEHRPSDPESGFPSPSEAQEIQGPVAPVVRDCTRCHDPHRGRDPFFLRPQPPLARLVSPQAPETRGP
jgi:predicted CXXCH cytochrome family protein